MSLKRTHKQSMIECIDVLKPKYTMRKATPQEILKLKPLNLESKLHFNNYYFVGGGYAAYVEGVTNFYNDIDIFRRERHYFDTDDDFNILETNEVMEYGNQNIKEVLNSLQYQYITMKYDGWFATSSINNFIYFIVSVLENFDLNECKVAYFFCYEDLKKNLGSYYYLRLKDTKYDVPTAINLPVKRMKKYIERSTKVPNLKYLALCAAKERWLNHYITLKEGDNQEEYLHVPNLYVYLRNKDILFN